MTLEDINALTVEDVKDLLLFRLGLEEDPQDGTLEDELEVYKSELIAELNEKLRVEDWTSRFNDISDLRMVCHDLGINEPNLKVFVKRIIEENDEAILLAIEAQAVITDADIVAKNANEDLIRAGQNKIGKCGRVLALVNGINEQKTDLTVAETQALLSTYGPIIQALGAGALETSKALIEAETPDGIVMTQADKDIILAEINRLL
jgi:hypothetical protein